MVGIILKFDNWSNNIFRVLFKDVDTSLWTFNINLWESYGKTNMSNDYNELDFIDSEIAKRELLHEDCIVYPEFLELFISKHNAKIRNLKSYYDYINSDCFMSLVIIDHRNIEICCKDMNLLQEIIGNFNESSLDNRRVIVLDEIQSDAIISAYRSKNEKSIYD